MRHRETGSPFDMTRPTLGVPGAHKREEEPPSSAAFRAVPHRELAPPDPHRFLKRHTGFGGNATTVLRRAVPGAKLPSGRHMIGTDPMAGTVNVRSPARHASVGGRGATQTHRHMVTGAMATSKASQHPSAVQSAGAVGVGAASAVNAGVHQGDEDGVGAPSHTRRRFGEGKDGKRMRLSSYGRPTTSYCACGPALYPRPHTLIHPHTRAPTTSGVPGAPQPSQHGVPALLRARRPARAHHARRPPQAGVEGGDRQA